MSNSIPDAPFPGLPRYTIKRKIGSGGMATVFLARDEVLHRDVALKMMHEHLMSSQETVKRFESEARTVASLSHENVIRVFDYGQTGSRPYLVMEYIEGTTLAALVERCGTLPNLIALEAARQIALGLSCTHGRGILHRDIKPDNVMIDRAGCIKIMDFGIAFIVNSESITLTGSFVGSPRFISPEQADGKMFLTGKTDIFSMGVLMYLALCGALPFDAETPMGAIHAIINDTPLQVFKRNPRVLFWLSDMVDAFLNKDPAARPDALGALALIEKECRAQDLQLGKERLKRFVGDPACYASEESTELFEHYRAAARAEAKKKRIASSLKKLEQAAAFGQLASEDRKILTKYVRRRFLRKAAALAGACLFGIMAMTLTVQQISGQAKSRVAVDNNKGSAPLVETRSVAPAAPVTAVQTRAPDTVSVLKKKAARNIMRKEAGAAQGAVSDTVLNSAQPGFLSVKTNPPWAKVFIDDIERGTTPATTTYRVARGSHEIRLLKEGFSEYRSTRAVSGPDTIPLRIQLEPLADPKP